MEIKWGIVWGIWVSIAVWGIQAFAGECTAKIGKVAYSGSFEMPEGGGSYEQMSIQVGLARHSKQLVANIFVGGDCQATCRLKVLPRSGAPEAPSSDFSCDGAFSAPATLFWSQDDPSIRFGTWLEGYTQVSVENVRENRALIASSR
jgi:hypothetical protein